MWQILDLLTVFLGELGTAGESAAEYLALYQSLLQQSPWKQYLALKGVLLYLAELLTEEINAIHKFEGSLLTSDLSQGSFILFLVFKYCIFSHFNFLFDFYEGGSTKFVYFSYP